MPNLDESVVHRGAGGSVHDSKVHDELQPPIMVAIRMEHACF